MILLGDWGTRLSVHLYSVSIFKYFLRVLKTKCQWIQTFLLLKQGLQGCVRISERVQQSKTRGRVRGWEESAVGPCCNLAVQVSAGMAFAPLAAWSVVPTVAWKCLLLSLPTPGGSCFCATSGYRVFILCLLHHPKLEVDRLLRSYLSTYHQSSQAFCYRCGILPGDPVWSFRSLFLSLSH